MNNLQIDPELIPAQNKNSSMCQIAVIHFFSYFQERISIYIAIDSGVAEEG